MPDSDIAFQVLTFKHKLLPTKRQHDLLSHILEAQRQLYNAALEHRIGAYRKCKRTISLYDQMSELTELRKDSKYSLLPVSMQRWTLRRLDNAYKVFYRRLKAKEAKAGFPRFRGSSRWRSFGFSEFNGIALRDNRLRIKGLPGSLRFHLHRPLPTGRPLGCTFTRDHKGWYICLQYRVPVQPLPATGRQVGIDVGLTTLAMLSTGEAIANPRHTKRAERDLRRRQRALSRCKRGSKRRKKVRTKMVRVQAKIANSRRTYLHQVSARLVREYDLLAVEKLNVKALASGIHAKAVNDAGWSMLKELLTYKAAKAGRWFIGVDCRFTSQTCPSCGQVAKKTLKQRTHRCDCGCVLDRDHAAALVILQRGCSESQIPQDKAS